MKKVIFVCIVLLLAAVILSAGCVSTPADPGTSTPTKLVVDINTGKIVGDKQSVKYTGTDGTKATAKDTDGKMTVGVTTADVKSNKIDFEDGDLSIEIDYAGITIEKGSYYNFIKYGGSYSYGGYELKSTGKNGGGTLVGNGWDIAAYQLSDAYDIRYGGIVVSGKTNTNALIKDDVGTGVTLEKSGSNKKLVSTSNNQITETLTI